MTVPTSHPLAADSGLSRRSLLRAGAVVGMAAGLGATALLSGCGSGDIVSAITPARFISFGDGLSDVGQGGSRYTINDIVIDGISGVTWADRLAYRYGQTLTSQAAGGLGYAQGHAPAAALPRTLTAQIDAFLGSYTLGANDVVLINLPMADVLGPVAAVKAGTTTEAAALAQIDASGRAHVAQVERLIAAGAKYIVTLGVYDLSRSPWAIAQNQVGFFSTASTKLNDAFKTQAVNLGANLLYVDTAFLVNRNSASDTAASYGFSSYTSAVCATADATTCTQSTLVSGATASVSLFADATHLTPVGNQQLGDYAYTQLSSRW